MASQLLVLLVTAGAQVMTVGPAAGTTENSIATVDDAGEVGWTSSVTLDASGYPVIAYLDNSNKNLKLAHCNDPNCAGNGESVVTVDNDTAVGGEASLVLDGEGFPVIAYHDANNGKLKLAHCNDPNCAAGGESIVTVDDAGEAGAWTSTHLALDDTGFPVISYVNAGTLRLAHCNDPNCEGGGDHLNTVDGSGNAGQSEVPLALDLAGHPVIAYYDDASTSLRLAHCNDANCAGDDERIETVDNNGNVGQYASMVLDSDGHPVVSYYDFTNGDLRLAHCNDANCAGGDESRTTLDSRGKVGWHTSLRLNRGGNPVVSYHDYSNSKLDLKIAVCGNADCAGGDETIVTVDSAGDVGRDTSLVLDASGFPVISYRDFSNGDLKLAHCASEPCDATSPSIIASVTGTKGDNGWYVSDVTVAFTVTDPQSDTTTSGCGGIKLTADTVAKTFTCSASSVGGTTKRSVTVKRDATDPKVTVTGVKNSASYADPAPAAGCITTDATSGVAKPASVSIHGPGSGIGAFTATCAGAMDRAGNRAKVATADYEVTVASTTEGLGARQEPFYVMVDSDGTVYAFPDSKHVGNAPIATNIGERAVDVAINPTGTGYYVLSNLGIVHPIGADVASSGNVDLATLHSGEQPVALALTKTGKGYWIFTDRGRAVPLGDAGDIGDVSDVTLAAPIVDAAPKAPGFYMTGGDGGVFTPPAFAGSQEVPFFGSVPEVVQGPLNQPIVTIYVDATDGEGYSLAAADGGMFNFGSEFCGSIPGVVDGPLNQPVVNAVPYGDCYIFFAADGGAFVFGDQPFLGSLGGSPPPVPIVSGDAYAT